MSALFTTNVITIIYKQCLLHYHDLQFIIQCSPPVVWTWEQGHAWHQSQLCKLCAKSIQNKCKIILHDNFSSSPPWIWPGLLVVTVAFLVIFDYIWSFWNLLVSFAFISNVIHFFANNRICRLLRSRSPSARFACCLDLLHWQPRISSSGEKFNRG